MKRMAVHQGVDYSEVVRCFHEVALTEVELMLQELPELVIENAVFVLNYGAC